jgi:hypothetical protein
LKGFCACPGLDFDYSQNGFVGGDAMNSTLKVQTSEPRTLIEKIKAEIRKRAETKARRMLLKAPKKQLKRT